MFHSVIDIILHLDTHLELWTQTLGGWLYVITFLIIFFESGVILTPFLPGDSLLFALGAVAAAGHLDFWILSLSLVAAAIIGGIFNFTVGKKTGQWILARPDSMFLRKAHLQKATAFYNRHGGKTILIARFVPIVRTFAPFIAGAARMPSARFLTYNVLGSVVWAFGLLALGYYFGNLPLVRRNFGLVVPSIIIVSLLPIAVEMIAAKRSKQSNG